MTVFNIQYTYKLSVRVNVDKGLQVKG